MGVELGLSSRSLAEVVLDQALWLDIEQPPSHWELRELEEQGLKEVKNSVTRLMCRYKESLTPENKRSGLTLD